MDHEIEWAVRRVLGSGPRLRFLFGDGAGSVFDLLRFLRLTVPKARAALAEIEALAAAIPDVTLRASAIGSARHKAYHVAGAILLATYLRPAAARHYVEIVAPLETIYDYLDTLCDRHLDTRPQAYRTLHVALADALDPSRGTHDYYSDGPADDDGGYLRTLVTRCQRGLSHLGDNERLLTLFAEAAQFYSDLQTYKHLPPGEREEACIAWYERHRSRFAKLEWYEFAAAAGSQFQVYVPLFMVFAGHGEFAERSYDAYFPAVAALHVLLDAFIDTEEDAEHGELNLATCYGSPVHMRERFALLAQQAYDDLAKMPYPHRHRFLLRTMALFYLTHPKVENPTTDGAAVRLLQCFDERAR